MRLIGLSLCVLALAGCDGQRRGGGGGSPGDPQGGMVGAKGTDPFSAPLGGDAGFPSTDATVGPSSDGSVPPVDAGFVDAAGGEDASAPEDSGSSSEPIRTCATACATADDCANPASPLYAADHYQCLNGGCIWIGCLDTTECVDAFQSSDYACAPVQGSSINNCTKTCLEAADCQASTLLTYDADNFSCVSNICQWNGCNSDAECEADQGSTYKCRTIAPATTPLCYQSCTTPADCSQGTAIFDEDNYQCEGGFCVWTGCNSAQECNSANPSISYACIEPL